MDHHTMEIFWLKSITSLDGGWSTTGALDLLYLVLQQNAYSVEAPNVDRCCVKAQ